jgi:hypothetical protein
MQVAARLEARPGDAVLLAAGGEPLIVSRAGASRLVETSLDFGVAENKRDSEIPLLVNLMFDHLFDSQLLDEVAIKDRGADSAKVAPPKRTLENVDERAPDTSRSFRDWTQPFLVAALLVLLWELIALARQWYRLNEYAGADVN